MTTRRTILAGTAAAGLALAGALLPVQAQAQEVTLRFASVTPAAGYIHSQHLAPFSERVEKASGGRLKLDLQPVGVYGSAGQLLELVENGIIDVAWIVNGYSPGRFEASGVIELPFLFESSEQATNAYYTMFEEGLFKDDFENLKVLALYTHRPYGTFSRGEPVRTLEDFKGLKVRVPSDVLAKTVEALGGSPVGMPVTEIAEALRLGTVDASMFPYEAVKPFGLEGLFKSFSNTSMLATRFAVVMNKDSYARLPDDLKAVIDAESGRAFSMEMAKGIDQAEAEVAASYRKNAEYQVVDPEPEAMEAMREAVKPVVETWTAETKLPNGDPAALLARARELAK